LGGKQHQCDHLWVSSLKLGKSGAFTLKNKVLQARNLTKRYGDLLAVSDLSLDVYAGEVFGLLGPNGAGKTTSINMMCGLLKPDGGYIMIHDQTIAKGIADLQSRVGVCPQEVVLWKKLTCLEQLQFIGEMYGLQAGEVRQRSMQLLGKLDLVEKTHKLARTLSGGMQRRLNLAMALVHDPEIVILDEPEAGLDPQSRVKVREYIKSLAHDKTIILTTHNMDEAERLADRVAIIDHGELLVLDTPEALKRSVGEGDVLEIALKDKSAPALAALDDLGDCVTVTLAGNILQIRALDIVNLLPQILDRLSAVGIQPGEVRLRENSLEDVFIRMTGRRLRE
jgi:ABC-2 type transport system ATP-binding protein